MAPDRSTHRTSSGPDAGRTPNDDLTAVVIVGVRLYREALDGAVSMVPGLTVIGAVADLARGLTVIARERPDFVVVDARLAKVPGTIRTLRRAHWPVSVIAFGVRNDPSEFVAFAELGVAAVVPEEAGACEILRVLAGVLDGELYCSPRTAGRLYRRVSELVLTDPRSDGPKPGGATIRPGAELTAREQEVASLVAQGLMNKEIARRLCISIPTVKNHVHRILAKRALTRRSQLIGRPLIEVLQPIGVLDP